MFYFTQQEKAFLVFLAAVIFFGSTIHYILKSYPKAKSAVHLMGSSKLYKKVDINRASLDELISIPYIGEQTARKIIEYRAQNGPFKNIDELLNVKGIYTKNFSIFSKYIKIHL